MSGHTPGPWAASLGELVRVTAAGSKGGHYPVVVCGVHRIGKHLGAERAGEVEANARLIAAAPDLLEALKGMVEAFAPPIMVDGEALPESDEAVLAAHAAIALAEGRA